MDGAGAHGRQHGVVRPRGPEASQIRRWRPPPTRRRRLRSRPRRETWPPCRHAHALHARHLVGGGGNHGSRHADATPFDCVRAQTTSTVTTAMPPRKMVRATAVALHPRSRLSGAAAWPWWTPRFGYLASHATAARRRRPPRTPPDPLRVTTREQRCLRRRRPREAIASPAMSDLQDPGVRGRARRAPAHRAVPAADAALRLRRAERRSSAPTSGSSTRTTCRSARSRCAAASTSWPSSRPSERARGVISASTGNHGQSIAYAARLFGVRAVICVPEGANPGQGRGDARPRRRDRRARPRLRRGARALRRSSQPSTATATSTPATSRS